MSATSGKVLLIPKGEYDATTQYKVLDWVLYQGRPYVAKQTTTGNAPIYAPTAQDPDAYWQLLLDFPTVVDNVPTQNSNNLVKSGGVYSVTADKMKKDGSNAENVIYSRAEEKYFTFASVTKDAGDSQNVILIFNPTTTAVAGLAGIKFAALFGAHVDNPDVYFTDSVRKYIVIDSAVSDLATDVVTVTAHLAEDDSAAISLSNVNVYFGSYIGSLATDNEIVGPSNAVSGSGVAEGSFAAVIGDFAHAEGAGIAMGDYSHAEGYQTAASTRAHSEGVLSEANGTGSHAEGYNTYARGDYSHTEGTNTYAVGDYSHAQGNGSKAQGDNSNAMGVGAYARNEGETAVGKYNSSVTTSNKKSLFSVGNGTADNARSNAFAVYEDGFMSNGGTANKWKVAKVDGVLGYYMDGDATFYPFKPYKEFENTSVVLSTSTDTTVTFSDASITADSTIEPFTSVYSIVPKDCVASAGQCVVTIPKQSTAQTIKVKIRVS